MMRVCSWRLTTSAASPPASVLTRGGLATPAASLCLNPTAGPAVRQDFQKTGVLLSYRRARPWAEGARCHPRSRWVAQPHVPHVACTDFDPRCAAQLHDALGGRLAGLSLVPEGASRCSTPDSRHTQRSPRVGSESAATQSRAAQTPLRGPSSLLPTQTPTSTQRAGWERSGLGSREGARGSPDSGARLLRSAQKRCSFACVWSGAFVTLPCGASLTPNDWPAPGVACAPDFPSTRARVERM